MPQRYITGISLMTERMGDKEEYSEEDFQAAKLPMVVACQRCTGTMTLASAWLYPNRDKGYDVYCAGEC